MRGITSLLEKLKKFKNKYYLNQLVKGMLLCISILIVAVITLSFTEYQFRLGTTSRLGLLLLFVGIALFILVKYLLIPAYQLLFKKDQISDERAAALIGKHFPEIEDKLLNIIQLNKVKAADNALIAASISQKTESLTIFNFSDSVSIKSSNRKYFPYLAGSAFILFIVLLFAPYMVTEGSYRIIKFNEHFIPKAPFTFRVENEDFDIFEGESYQLKVTLTGSQIPQELYIYKNKLKFKMNAIEENTFEISFNRIQSDIHFQLEAAGFKSELYSIKVFEKPIITDIAIELQYPSYTLMDKQRIFNNGDLIMPEGTQVSWLVASKATNSITFFTKDTSYLFNKEKDNFFNFNKTFYNNSTYQLALNDLKSKAQASKPYNIVVIKDEYPKINLNAFSDSTFFKSILISGEIADDYGLRQLKLFYSIKEGERTIKSGSKNIPFNSSTINQKYFLQWAIDSLLTNKDQYIVYYTKVWDNDAVNGSKAKQSVSKIFKLPSEIELNEAINKTAQQSEDQLDDTILQSLSLNEKLEALDKILKTRKELSFEDKKLLEQIMEESRAIEEQLNDFKEKLVENAQKRQQFDKSNSDLDKKAEQLQDLMNEMLENNKNEELMKKIEELLKEKQNNSDDFRESSENLQKREKNRLKEMARLMELFKRLEIEYDIYEVKNELSELQDKQEQTAAESDIPLEQKKEEQQALNESFEDIKEDLQNIKERNQDLKQPSPITDTKDAENDIDQAQQESSQQLDDDQKDKARESQQKAADKMQEMGEMMEQMQSSMGGGEQMQEDMDNIRDIVDNLLKLSYRQEGLMKAFRELDPSDPRFISLSEEQLTLKDDAVIIEDSLTSLANRVFQLKNFITKEMTEMNTTIDKSIESLQVRDVSKSVGYQQFSMTSMNNLALLLDDILEQMQMQSKSGSSSSSGNKQEPSAGERQKALNQKTKQLSEQQQKGREFSEKLAELAAEQGRIKKQIQEMQSENDDEGSKPGGLGSLIEQMEEIEEDLVNKNLDARLIKRQEQIVTKLLEAEKAKKEQEEDEERKGETASEYDRVTRPTAFDKYLRERKSEIEQLKTIPPTLSPYYKKEVNKYFNRVQKVNQPDN